MINHLPIIILLIFIHHEITNPVSKFIFGEIDWELYTIIILNYLSNCLMTSTLRKVFKKMLINFSLSLIGCMKIFHVHNTTLGQFTLSLYQHLSK